LRSKFNAQPRPKSGILSLATLNQVEATIWSLHHRGYLNPEQVTEQIELVRQTEEYRTTFCHLKSPQQLVQISIETIEANINKTQQDPLYCMIYVARQFNFNWGIGDFNWDFNLHCSTVCLQYKID